MGPVSPYVLLVTGMVIFIGCTWLSVATRIMSEDENATQRALDRANWSARSFEQYALRTLKAADNLTRFAIVSLSHNTPEETVRRALQAEVIDGEIFQGFSIIDRQGDLLGTTLAQEGNFNFSDRDYFQTAASQSIGTLIVGAPIVSRMTGDPGVPIVRRYEDAAGNFAGIVVIQVRTEALALGYRDLLFSSNDYIALVGFDGIVRSGSIAGQSVQGRDFTQYPTFKKQKQSPEGSFSGTSKQDNVFRHVSYRTLDGYPLFVAFGVDAADARQEFQDRRSEYVALGALTTLIVLVFGWGLGMSLRRKDMVNAQLRAREDALRTLATRDPLTNLPNRGTLEPVAQAKLDHAKASGTEVACIFIDLDGFGDINAAMGHPFGDEVLKSVALAIAPVGEAEGHLARVGGDEFVMVLEADEGAEIRARVVAGRIQEMIERPFFVNGIRIDLKASIGISLFPRHARSVVELVRCANEAMAVSKEGRRGRPVLFSVEMDRRAEKRLTVRAGLQEALDNNYFELLYQPQVDLQTRRVVGLEALLRWRHPVDGYILPGDFIPVAEESGLIMPIGAWAIMQACLDGAALVRDGFPPIAVAVNVSALQLREPELLSVVAKALSASGFPPALLELELTESMIADDPEATITLLEGLRALGVTLAIDDFGTGYSNLQYLRRFPVNVLKIDQSFVRDISNPSSASIIMAILGVAKALTLEVVAEGVETAEQEAFLARNGCDFAQGFIYGKPVLLSEFQEHTARQCA